VSEPCSLKSSLCEPEIPAEASARGSVEKLAKRVAEASDMRSLDGVESEFTGARPNNID